MPKQTFYNLPEEKRQIIIAAVKKEFSRVPLYEASIANIVETAGIPRGSFYQYFEDKDDAFFYILNEHGEMLFEAFIKTLKKYDGDLFNVMTEMFRLILLEVQRQENRNFFRNTFLNLNQKVENTLMKGINQDEHKQFIKVSNLINVKKLNITTNNELFHVTQITAAVLLHNIGRKFMNNLSTEEAMDNFQIELNLLKKGLYKEEYKSN